jgi:hypothetical protein
LKKERIDDLFDVLFKKESTSGSAGISPASNDLTQSVVLDSPVSSLDGSRLPYDWTPLLLLNPGIWKAKETFFVLNQTGLEIVCVLWL